MLQLCSHVVKKLQCKHLGKTHSCHFYCAKNCCGNSARDPSRYISGPKAKVLGLAMSSFLQTAFYPGPRGHSNTKNTAPPTPSKTTDQGFYHNIAERHGYVCSLTQKCVVSIRISNKWLRGQGWQTLVMVLRQTVGLLWWNLEVRKLMKYLIGGGTVTNTVWISLSLEQKLEFDLEVCEER